MAKKMAVVSFLSGFKEGFRSFGLCVTAIINTVLLTLTYFFAVALTSLAARAFKKQFLDLSQRDVRAGIGQPSSGPKKSTYWEELNLYKKDIKEYYRQF